MTAARRRSAAAIPLTLVLIVALSIAQQDQSTSGDTSDTLSSSPQIFGTAPQQFRVVPLKGFQCLFQAAGHLLNYGRLLGGQVIKVYVYRVRRFGLVDDTIQTGQQHG